MRPLICALVIPIFAEEPDPGNGLFNLPGSPDESAPLPPVQHLSAWGFPLKYGDGFRIAVILVAILGHADGIARSGVNIATTLRATLGVSHWLVTEPANPHPSTSYSTVFNLGHWDNSLYLRRVPLDVETTQRSAAVTKPALLRCWTTAP